MLAKLQSECGLIFLIMGLAVGWLAYRLAKALSTIDEMQGHLFKVLDNLSSSQRAARRIKAVAGEGTSGEC